MIAPGLPPRLVLGGALAAAVSVAGIVAFAFRGPPREPVEIHLAPDAPPAPAEIRTYVSGAVRFPGVYQLLGDQRVEDALRAAGGALDEADLERLNLAERLRDGGHVLVPRRGQQVPIGTVGSHRLNLNTASAGELDQTLPNIGKVRAERIVASRASEGPFQEPFDLVSRKIIPLSVFRQIEHLVYAQ